MRQYPSLLEKYGVSLMRLGPEDLELVRYWRNHPKINKYMGFRGEITPEMQQDWFGRINNDNNFYYIIIHNDKKIGMTNIKDVDHARRCGESGVFFWDDDCLNSDIPFRSAFCINDFCFETLDLEYVEAHILRDNPRAIRFNKLIGFTLQDGQEDEENQLYRLDRDTYLKTRERYVKLFD